MTDKPHDDLENDDQATGLDADGEDGPKIAASDEMEAALQEAIASSEKREAEQRAAAGGDSGGGAASADKMTIEMLSQELQDLKGLHEEKLAEIAEKEDAHLRLQAEFENFRRRGLKEKQESFKFGHQNLVKDLLSAVDNLERALEHGAQNAGAEVKGILDGVELVYREILGTLAKHAVQEIQAEGAVFDPAVHEAMGQIPNGAVPPNTVLQVLQKGYVIHDRMIRPSRVIVSREPTAEEAAAAGGTPTQD
ncbi:MAG: nucleotide exchange factor GrpE [bacterium]|nr:nucleotide exchange factor GrpE [bacterium]